jgi:hypothetical protein
MLLHGDGTNGAQNNTFLDSSTNNFTITRNGNTTQGSFSPYGSNWSNYFNGSSYLSLATATALGTGNVTVEFWFNTPDISATYYALYEGRSTAGTNTGLGIFQYGQTIEIYGNGLKVSSAASAFTANTWTHFAVVRTSGTCQIYINGVASGSSASYSDNYTSTTRRIGQNASNANTYTGYISNLREVTSALYSGTFTPSITPLTAVSGTTLLTCQSNRFIDNSSNAYAITVNGTPSVQRFNPFGTATAYSTSVIGGSGYFDGSGDYLGCGSQSVYAFGTSNFTMECWAYATSFISYNSLTGSRGNSSDASNTNYSFGVDSGGSVYFYSAGFLVTSSAGAIKLNSWNHIALVRSGTGASQSVIYVNGVSAGTGTISNNLSGTSFAVGGLVNGDEPFTGYITNVRLNNTALYSTTFTPPTAPLTAVSGTSLLLNTINGAIFDNAMMNDLETVGNAQISTSVVKYGTGSMYFDGTGDALIGQNTPNISLSGNFTIEAWVYQTNAGQNAPQLCIGDAANSGGILLYISTGQQLSYFINGGSGASGTATINTWHHIAVVRSGSTITTYLNGVAQNIVTTSTTFSGVPYFGAGLYSSVLYYGAGYMDDLRITKGYARYTVDFTPPTSAFPNFGPT